MQLLQHSLSKLIADHNHVAPFFVIGYFGSQAVTELQKRADRADQSVLIFLAGANFWEKHAKKCAFMSMAHSTYTIAH